jgi:hypothetical protein
MSNIGVMKRCVISDCTLEGNFSVCFKFPKDSDLVEKWISRLPLLDYSKINFEEAVLCEHHFNPKELLEDYEFNKELARGAVPEYFQTNNDINSDSCRFCLRIIEGGKIPIDQMIKSHYQNVMQQEISSENILQSICKSCHVNIRNFSHMKNKIQENQIQISNLLKTAQSEFLEIKMELYLSDEERDSDSTMKLEATESKRSEVIVDPKR